MTSKVGILGLLLVGQVRQQIRQSKNIADILFELAEFAAGIVDPGWQRGPAQLPVRGFVLFQTAALVLATATTGTWLITVLSRWKREASSLVATIQARDRVASDPSSAVRESHPGSSDVHFFLRLFLVDC